MGWGPHQIEEKKSERVAQQSPTMKELNCWSGASQENLWFSAAVGLRAALIEESERKEKATQQLIHFFAGFPCSAAKKGELMEETCRGAFGSLGWAPFSLHSIAAFASFFWFHYHFIKTIPQFAHIPFQLHSTFMLSAPLNFMNSIAFLLVFVRLLFAEQCGSCRP